MNRRQFIYYSALAAGATAFTSYAQPRQLSPNNKLNIALIGCGGKGASDLRCCADAGENIVALCDVVESDAVAHARASFPHAKFYKDFREKRKLWTRLISPRPTICTRR
jgi:hypothetical protein